MRCVKCGEDMFPGQLRCTKCGTIAEAEDNKGKKSKLYEETEAKEKKK